MVQKYPRRKSKEICFGCNNNIPLLYVTGDQEFHCHSVYVCVRNKVWKPNLCMEIGEKVGLVKETNADKISLFMVMNIKHGKTLINLINDPD